MCDVFSESDSIWTDNDVSVKAMMMLCIYDSICDLLSYQEYEQKKQAKADPKRAEAKKDKNDACRERRKDAGSTKVINR